MKRPDMLNERLLSYFVIESNGDIPPELLVCGMLIPL